MLNSKQRKSVINLYERGYDFEKIKRMMPHLYSRQKDIQEVINEYIDSEERDAIKARKEAEAWVDADEMAARLFPNALPCEQDEYLEMLIRYIKQNMKEQ